MIRETIKKEMAIRKDTVASLAREIGSHTAPLYNYINGKAGLSYRCLVKICILYDLVLIKRFD